MSVDTNGPTTFDLKVQADTASTKRLENPLCKVPIGFVCSSVNLISACKVPSLSDRTLS